MYASQEDVGEREMAGERCEERLLLRRMPMALLVAECRRSSLYLKRYRSMQGSVQHFCLLTHTA